LPLVVLREKLVTANAFAVTGGTIGVVIGGGIGIASKKFFDHHMTSDRAAALIIILGTVIYLVSGLLTRLLRRLEIGPKENEGTQQDAGWADMIEGFHILREHSDALRGIIATSIQRGGLTALTMMVLLLERNTYHPASNPDAGLAGFAAMLTIAGCGVAFGAFISPRMVKIFGRHLWIRLALVLSTPSLILFIAFPNIYILGVAAFLIAAFGQAVKVSNDALVQNKIHDEYRGRTFAFYDMTVNTAIVAGAFIGALVLPKSGESRLLPLLIIVTYIVTSGYFLRKSTFRSDSTISSIH
jgi:predicted MFS family arabinose efflux permease